MTKTQVWIHRRMVFSKKGEKDFVAEGMCKKGSLDAGHFNILLLATENGWNLKETTIWETKQTNKTLPITSVCV